MQPELRILAHIRSEFPTKFGIPRQSGLVPALRASVVFEPAFRNPEAVRGLEDFSHIWLIWHFSQVPPDTWSPTVRPPRLGGNRRMGVFATRSPFRPNALGLSCVRLESIFQHPDLGPVLCVSGADLMDGSPILDIKPYVPYTDAHPEATGGFTSAVDRPLLEVEFPPELFQKVPAPHQDALLGVLSQDPRPSYQDDPGRVYGMAFAGFDVRFTVQNRRLFVQAVEMLPPAGDSKTPRV